MGNINDIITSEIQTTKLNNTNQSKNLVCFDFDNTIVLGHFHNYLTGKFVYPKTRSDGLIVNGELSEGAIEGHYFPEIVEEKTLELLSQPGQGIRDPKGLKELFDSILSKGDKIAITSFTLFPDAISTTLKSLGLEQEQLNNINVVAGFPRGGDVDRTDKNSHIFKAMKLVEVKDEENVILVDDSFYNIEKAVSAGFKTVWVDDDFQWSKVQSQLNQMTIKNVMEEAIKGVEEEINPAKSLTWVKREEGRSSNQRNSVGFGKL